MAAGIRSATLRPKSGLGSESRRLIAACAAMNGGQLTKKGWLISSMSESTRFYLMVPRPEGGYAIVGHADTTESLGDHAQAMADVHNVSYICGVLESFYADPIQVGNAAADAVNGMSVEKTAENKGKKRARRKKCQPENT